MNRGDAALYGPFPVAPGRLHQAGGLFVRLARPQLSIQPQEGQGAAGRAGYPNGFDMDLEWAEFQGWTFNEFVQLVARFFGDVGVRVKLKQLETSTWLNRVAGVSRSPTAGCRQSYRRRAELRGLGVPALPLGVPAERSTARASAIRSSDDLLTTWRQGSRGETAGPAARHLGPLARQGVPGHDHRAAALPHHPGVRPRRGEPVLLVPGYCSYEAKTAWMTDQSAQPENSRSSRSNRPAGQRCDLHSRAGSQLHGARVVARRYARSRAFSRARRRQLQQLEEQARDVGPLSVRPAGYCANSRISGWALCPSSRGLGFVRAVARNQQYGFAPAWTYTWVMQVVRRHDGRDPVHLVAQVVPDGALQGRRSPRICRHVVSRSSELRIADAARLTVRGNAEW